ncbi:MAG: tRNA pseudouridine(13) synthase TruD [Planctomycetes bacterium]|nr:tRNA pseudouridine(13) synthase TruD [Planctomycetota bacterium]MCB9934785.1 tRNA pseudouridine(13) synthase TruD [Planctomycetota bacterium]
MKLKSVPEDFVVEEVSDFTPNPGGRFFVYALEKRSLATLEALHIIARHAGVRERDLSAAGLKDKHGLTRQLFSSTRALPVFSDERLKLRLVGKSVEKLTAGSILGNRFTITLRNLREDVIARLPRNVNEIQRFGLPNYYDNQRFGGIAHGRGFIGRALVLGDFEQALRLHLAAPHRKQSLTDKSNRRLADQLWGDWHALHKRMKRSPERALVEYLKSHPDDWAGCFERITPSLRNLFVAAYQSWLFNETLRRMVEASAPFEHVKYKAGMFAFYRNLPEELLARWRDVELPLPGPGTRPDDFPDAAPHLRAVLESEGISLEQLSLPDLERTGFKASTRRALLWPKDLQLGELQADELNPGAEKVVVKFELGRGSFGTMVTRRLGI